ncbi:MAG: MaoC family dehydratase [Rhizobiales bacterium]|nr:MaoC family dehydratase [Hyphomicrobiales bacterium]
MSALLYFEDFPVGDVSTFGAYEVTAEEIKAFAGEFDPQPFHLDEAAGARSIAGALSASGWHTTAMCMRMMYDGYIGRTASMGSPGVDEAKWLKPVFPGDILSMRRTTLEARISASRPEMGIIKSRWEVLDQDGEIKLEMTGYGLVKVRGAGS